MLPKWQHVFFEGPRKIILQSSSPLLHCILCQTCLGQFFPRKIIIQASFSTLWVGRCEFSNLPAHIRAIFLQLSLHFHHFPNTTRGLPPAFFFLKKSWYHSTTVIYVLPFLKTGTTPWKPGVGKWWTQGLLRKAKKCGCPDAAMNASTVTIHAHSGIIAMWM